MGCSMSTVQSATPGAIVVYALLLDYAGRRMLVRDRSGQLPDFCLAPVFYPEVEELVERVRQVCGLEVAILHCLEEGDANNGRPRLYSAVCVSEDDDPRPGFSWTGLDEPLFGGDAPENLERMARVELDRLSGGALSEPSTPWTWPASWHRSAREWTAANLPPPSDGHPWRMAQIRSWSISSVFRVTSGKRRLYFKASPSFFASEVAVTRDVADRFPGISPKLMAADTERGWMLMEDLGNLTLSKTDSAELWRETMRTIASVQHGYADRIDTMEQLGIERRTTGAIVDTLADWTQNSSLAALRIYHKENDAALRRLEPSLGNIANMARRLEELGLPQTLEHGDLDSTNIFIQHGVPILMDWSDACISHPFFTPLTPTQARRNPDIVEAYLREWTDYAPLESLRGGFEIAKPLSALESAFHYHRNIVPYLPYSYPDFRTLERYIPALLEMAADALGRMAGDE